MKTFSCYSSNPSEHNINCPVCSSLLNDLAAKLPYSHRLNSCLIDQIDGSILDEANLPLVLPNGSCYGTEVNQKKFRGKTSFASGTFKEKRFFFPYFALNNSH